MFLLSFLLSIGFQLKQIKRIILWCKFWIVICVTPNHFLIEHKQQQQKNDRQISIRRFSWKYNKCAITKNYIFFKHIIPINIILNISCMYKMIFFLCTSVAAHTTQCNHIKFCLYLLLPHVHFIAFCTQSTLNAMAALRELQK